MRKSQVGALLLVLCLWVAAVAAEDDVVNQNKVTKTFTGDHLNVSLNSDNCHVQVNGQCDSLNVRGKRSEVVVSGATKACMVPGSNNKITVHGGLGSMLIGGNENAVQLTGTSDPAPHIEIAGNGNVIQWSKSKNAQAPDWVDNGRHNKLKEVP